MILPSLELHKLSTGFSKCDCPIDQKIDQNFGCHVSSFGYIINVATGVQSILHLNDFYRAMVTSICVESLKVAKASKTTGYRIKLQYNSISFCRHFHGKIQQCKDGISFKDTATVPYRL